tara:strand:+ start:2619 stop:3380 length:762 start_codon:yes stop_codon:yes gene_type:complete
MIEIIQTYKTCEMKYFYKVLYNCFTDDELWETVLEYCTTIKNFNACETYKDLPNKIHKLDFWRYIYIYLNGGLYIDIDIQLKPNFMNYLSIFENNEVVLFKESPSINDGYFIYICYCCKYFFRIIDHPRFFQYRQSIFYAKKNNEFLKKLIDEIIFNFYNEKYLEYYEPALTFELTGPGIFTDVMKYSSHHLIEYSFSKELMDYHSTGSWRKHFNPLLNKIYILQNIILICLIWNCIISKFYKKVFFYYYNGK